MSNVYPEGFSSFPWDRECICGECPVCCPAEYEDYAQAWDEFYEAAEARIAAGMTAFDALYDGEDEATNKDLFSDTHGNADFRDDYERYSLPRFPLVHAHVQAEREAAKAEAKARYEASRAAWVARHDGAAV